MPQKHKATESPVVEEFESTPVPKRAQKGVKAFWGMYAGEHAAGT
jgi:hypothetical protein